ncbi:methyltransferase domain-containing protein [Tepidicaulis sp. LMO-SS28]|uniref:methyltransferase domain-containing protein n=1 Tax=Tepidicaulis sp. LMO-SS28 TaxID=3447455 RepID=UPI003EE15488
MDAVKERYSAAAEAREEALCCPVDYDPRFLKVIPEEVLERDYGCGDPSAYVREGETVLDLGAGGGKICFIASQIVGPKGRVIGVDMTDEMLELARRAQPIVAEKTGFDNVEFRHGHIQDLALDLDALGQWLESHPVKSAADYKILSGKQAELRRTQPLVADASVDVIVSNCVLNLVPDHEKPQLFREMFRVLKPGGRIAVSDIVSDRESPAHLKADPALWSGCISGALTEKGFADALAEAGFAGVRFDKFDHTPWQVVEEIEYRSVTVTAVKPATSCAARAEATALYAGPWASVTDETGQRFTRGDRVTVSGDTAARLRSGAYDGMMIVGEPKSSCC